MVFICSYATFFWSLHDNNTFRFNLELLRDHICLNPITQRENIHKSLLKLFLGVQKAMTPSHILPSHTFVSQDIDYINAITIEYDGESDQILFI